VALPLPACGTEAETTSERARTMYNVTARSLYIYGGWTSLLALTKSYREKERSCLFNSLDRMATCVYIHAVVLLLLIFVVSVALKYITTLHMRSQHNMMSTIRHQRCMYWSFRSILWTGLLSSIGESVLYYSVWIPADIGEHASTNNELLRIYLANRLTTS